MSSFSSMCVTPAPSSLTAVPSDVNGSAPRSKSVLNTTNSCVVGPALVMLNFTLRVDAVPGVTAMPKSFSATSTVVSSEPDADGSAVLSLHPDDTKPIVRTTNNNKTFLIPASSRQLPRQCIPRMARRALARALDHRFEVNEALPQAPLNRRARKAPAQLAHPAEGQLEILDPFHAGTGAVGDDLEPRIAQDGPLVVANLKQPRRFPPCLGHLVGQLDACDERDRARPGADAFALRADDLDGRPEDPSRRPIPVAQPIPHPLGRSVDTHDGAVQKHVRPAPAPASSRRKRPS